MVLKLQHPVPIDNFKIAAGNPKSKAGYWDIGFNHTNPYGGVEDSENFLLFFWDHSFKHDEMTINPNFLVNPYLLVLKGNCGPGFSGSPLIDLYGNLVGMVQSGYQTFPDAFLNRALDKKVITIELYNKILTDYRNGFTIALALDANYIKRTYLNNLK